MKKLALALCALMLTTAAYAEGDHSLGDISGTGIRLKTHDHAFAGAIGDFVAWGFLDEDTGISTLTIRKYGNTITTEFKRDAKGRTGGVIGHSDGDGQHQTHVYYVGMDAKNLTFFLSINGEKVPVKIEYEGYQNNHFVNPTYIAQLGDEKLSYRMEGEACINMSAHFAMMILGAYAH